MSLTTLDSLAENTACARRTLEALAENTAGRRGRWGGGR
jgi:hypothetical protein